MKDELLKYLNIKLKYIDDNIETLERMNEKLQEENKSLDYYEKALNIFNDENGNCDIYKFDEVDKENYERILNKLDDSIKSKFDNVGCNYDGLVYLINGINNGISLKLTDEQVDAINSFIDGISKLKLEHLACIDGITLAKSNLDIDDLSVLNDNKNKYEKLIENLMADDYVKDIDDINDALDFSNVSLEDKVKVYEYILKSNATIFEKKSLEKPHDSIDKEDIKLDEESIDKEIEDVKENIEENEGETIEENVSIPIVSEDEFDIDIEDDFKPFTLPQVDAIKLGDNKNDELEAGAVDDLESRDEINEEVSDELVEEDNIVENNLDDLNLPLADEEIDLPLAEEENKEEVDEDFKDIDDGNSYEEEKASEEINVSSTMDINQLNELLNKYNIKVTDEEKSLLLTGNINNYEEVLSYLVENKYINYFNKNSMLTNILLYSNKDSIINVLELIKKHLSIDEDDFKVTFDIIIKTLPSVFILEPNGLYNTFTRNINLLSGFGIDLINLFDNSREVFVCDSSVLVDNYNIVSSYGIKVDENNAKYLLMLSSIGEKIDYFVESVYKDGITGNVFDGNELINLYPVKLNSVKDLTIKRLRYSSETGKKIFGSKEKSLAGEITNLNVDVINMPGDYLNSFFNNEFDTLTNEELSNYKNIINNDKSFDMEMDSLLNKLEPFSNGIRYVINNIYISKNKVIRIYNILKKNGITGNNALLFSVCYNLVITKDEYKALLSTIQNLGDE